MATEKKKRARDPLYDAIADTWSSYTAGRIGKLKSVLIGKPAKGLEEYANSTLAELPVSAEELTRWAEHTRATLPPEYSFPSKYETIVKSIIDYRARNQKPARPSAPPLSEKAQEAIRIQQLMYAQLAELRAAGMGQKG